jgi:putative ABC transport system permease protein
LSALLTRSLLELNAVHPGLDPQGRVTLDLTLSARRFNDVPSVLGFYDAVQQRLQELPGIERAALIRNLPLRDNQRRERIAREQAVDDEERIGVAVQLASAGVLQTLGVRLVEGREFEASDLTDAPLVALVNRSAATALWQDESALGMRVRAWFMPADHGLITIVGVYEDVRNETLAAAPGPEIILPFTQVPQFLGAMRNATVVMQSNSDAATIIPTARQAIHSINPGVPVEAPTTMVEVVRASSSRERFIASLLAVFAGLALVISAVGVFGVVSFTVARQTREFAIRNALGAGSGEILAGVLRKNLSVAGAGALAGAILALLAAPGLRSFLYNVAPRDPLIMAGVPLMLIAVAMLSSLAPALRATRVSPARALQESD